MKKRNIYYYKDKFLRQIVVCFIIYATYKSMGMIDFNIMKEVKATFEAAIMKDYTATEIKSAAVRCVGEIKDINKAITAVVIKANEESIENNINY